MIQGSTLITGVTGMIGRELARALLDAGCEVHGVARFSSPGSRDEINAMGVTTWQHDLASDPLDGIPDVDYVFHEAAFWDKTKAGAEGKQKVMAQNTLAAGRVMYRWRNAKAIMLASTGGLYHESIGLLSEETPVEPNPDRQNYHLGKFAMEQVGLFCSVQFEVPTVILRYFWPVKFEDVARRVVDAVLKGEPMKGKDPEEPYQWTPIDLSDLIEYTARSVEVADVPPRVLVCGGPEVVTRKELCEAAGEVLGVEPVFGDESQFHWERFLSDSSRLYALLGEPKKRLTDVVRKMAEEARG
jgi:UDP-glucuronate 4-epimerase